MTIVPALDLRSSEPHPAHAPANIEAEQALLARCCSITPPMSG